MVAYGCLTTGGEANVVHFRGHNSGFPDPDWQESERWGRTWDPTGARRPAGPQLALHGLYAAIGFALLALLLTMCA